jgi:N-acetylmuramoyl-L-alanine amidase
VRAGHRRGWALLGTLVLAAWASPGAGAPAPAAGRARPSARPDAALYREAQASEGRLRASSAKMARTGQWEAVVLRYRKVVARYPRSGYCDNALLAVGNLYREMARRFGSARYREDAASAYRTLVAEYPSSSLGDSALSSVVDLARESKDRDKVMEAGKAYLDAYPEGKDAARVKTLLRQRSAPVPSPPPPGLARVFDLRSWSGDSSTRVVIDLERKVKIESDRARNPDRLWIDLIGTRLHPNLARRVFPVGDGLLEQVRIAPNRPDVVRVVLDFKDVADDQMFYLDDPPRLVVDVRGRAASRPQVAEAAPPAAAATRADGSGPSGGKEESSAKTEEEPSPEPMGREPAKADASASATSAAVPPAGLAAPGPSRAAPPPATSEPPPPRATATPATAMAATPAAVTPAAAPAPPVANRAGSYSLARQLGLGARRIVIDAGHGGHDPGTIGHGGLQEKDLVLDVALRLERLVSQELGTEVVLTRSTDVFVPLEERTAIANSRGADLFLSIHANSSRNSRARGIETYFLNFARTSHAEEVAARENAISAATLKDLQTLVKAITLNSKIDESRDFAAAVQESMVAGVGKSHAVPDRGVHTAPFYVLIGANMPAILAEISFVSNPEDEKRLRSGAYRDLIARSLLKGVKSYLEALNRTQMRQLTDATRRSTFEAATAPSSR